MGRLAGRLGGGRVGRVRQPVLPLLPADATPIGPAAGLVDSPDGGTVFVFGQATFAFATDDEVGRRLAAVQLVATEIASAAAVAAGFIPAKCGPKGPTKLTAAMVARIQALATEGHTRTAIAAAVQVSPATVRVALGRPSAGAGRSARPGRDPQQPDRAATSAVADSAGADNSGGDSAGPDSAR